MGNKKLIDQEKLSSEQFGILAKAVSDVFFFAQFVFLIHPLLGKIPFALYAYQQTTLLRFLQHRFNVILKFRQAGVTELISLYCLWYAMYHPHKNIVIISIKDRVAKKVLRKIKFMYKSLPPFLKTRVVNGRGQEIGTSTEMEFANGSIISSIPTTEDAGRSEAVSLLVIDEAAIVRWADRIWAASFPTLSTGGRAIINSTAYGVGNFFHKLFTTAVAGGNVFNAIRLYWRMHPERDDDWYRQQKEILGPRKTAQEIDGDFLTSGNTVFDMSDVKCIEDYLIELVPLETRMNGQLRIFERPKPGLRYTLAMDIATGRANDFTTMSIMDQHGDEKACMKAKIGIDKAEQIAAKYGKMYKRAVVAPESNDVGLGVAMGLQNGGYRNLYYSKQLLKKKGKKRPEVQEIPGWYTTKKNRPLIIAKLEEDVRNDTNRTFGESKRELEAPPKIKDRDFCSEAPTFIYDARNRPVALNKDKESTDELFNDEVYNDDAIFAKAICNWVREEPVRTKTIMPR